MNQAKLSVNTQAVVSFAHSKDADGHRWINRPIFENFFLIWLNGDIDENSSDCQNILVQLHRAVHTIDTFKDGEECIDFLGDMADDKGCMIISDSLAQQIVPLVHNMSQVDSIFVLSSSQKYDKEWIADWPKIQGPYTEIEPISDAVKKTALRLENNAISISFIKGSDSLLEKNGNRLDPSFMYTQIMKEIFLTINFEEQHLKEFVEHCQKTFDYNEARLKPVKEFAEKYSQHTPIWWYAQDSFLYPMLNRALRMMDVDIMIKLAFFIRDLHQHIEEVHQKRYANSPSNQRFTFYRGQGMQKKDFVKMEANKGGLISFNSFLSTSTNLDIALMFAECSSMHPDLLGVLFIMDIDVIRPSTPFASATDVEYLNQNEAEVLFSMHAVFRIVEITAMDENPRIFQVKLNLVSDKDNDLCQLIHYIRHDICPNDEGWYRLGCLLLTMGESAKAQQVYEILLGQETEESTKVSIYHQLAVAKKQLGEYEKALEYYNEFVKIKEKQSPRPDLELAMAYNNIGEVYDRMDDDQKALSSYEKALIVFEQSLPPTHRHLTASYNNIGLLYHRMNDYGKALSSYEKALAIQQQSLPSTHPELAATYNNIGMVYYRMIDYQKALSFHEKALKVRQESLPPTHSDLALSYNNIGNVYNSMGDYRKACFSYEEALKIQHGSLPSSHPDLAPLYNNIGIAYNSMGDYQQALSFYEKALAIQEQSLPSTHIHLAKFYNNIGLVYTDKGAYEKALSYNEQALSIKQQCLSPTHPALSRSYNNLGLVYLNMGNYPKAFSSYEKALTIQQQLPLLDHLNLLHTYCNMGLLHNLTSNLWKAYYYYEYVVDIALDSSPANHLHLERWRNELVRIKQKF